MQVTCSDAIEIVGKWYGLKSETVYQQDAWPDRSDYQEIETDSSGGGPFTLTLQDGATAEAEDDVLMLAIKVWDASGNSKVKRYRFTALESTPLDDIEPTQV